MTKESDSQNAGARKSIRRAWGFYVFWIFANGIGTIIGVVTFFILAQSIGAFGMPLPEQQAKLEIAWKMIVSDFIISMPFGGVIGIMQWLVIRKYITKSGFWFLTSAIAMFIGISIASMLSLLYQLAQLPTSFIIWFLFGGVSGVLQWVILRRQITSSTLWILVNVIAGGTAGIFSPELGIIGGCIGWIVTGILTGGTILFLLRKAKRFSDNT